VPRTVGRSKNGGEAKKRGSRAQRGDFRPSKNSNCIALISSIEVFASLS